MYACEVLISITFDVCAFQRPCLITGQATLAYFFQRTLEGSFSCVTFGTQVVNSGRTRNDAGANFLTRVLSKCWLQWHSLFYHCSSLQASIFPQTSLLFGFGHLSNTSSTEIWLYGAEEERACHSYQQAHAFLHHVLRNNPAFQAIMGHLLWDPILRDTQRNTNWQKLYQ